MKQSNNEVGQSYNGQTGVDAENGIVVAAELLPIPDVVETNLGEVPRQTLADAGHRSEEAFATLVGRDTDLVVLLGRDGRATYRCRKHIVEPLNGWTKQVLGFRRFSLWDVKKVRAEWKLVNSALNLRRMMYL